MVTYVLVSSESDGWDARHPALENIIMAQHDSQRNFGADWLLARNKAAMKFSKSQRGYSAFDIYKFLEGMGWSITSLHCTEVSY